MKADIYSFAFAQNILTALYTLGLPIAIGISIGFASGNAAGARPESVIGNQPDIGNEKIITADNNILTFIFDGVRTRPFRPKV